MAAVLVCANDRKPAEVGRAGDRLGESPGGAHPGFGGSCRDVSPGNQGELQRTHPRGRRSADDERPTAGTRPASARGRRQPAELDHDAGLLCGLRQLRLRWPIRELAISASTGANVLGKLWGTVARRHAGNGRPAGIWGRVIRRHTATSQSVRSGCRWWAQLTASRWARPVASRSADVLQSAGENRVGWRHTTATGPTKEPTCPLPAPMCTPR